MPEEEHKHSELKSEIAENRPRDDEGHFISQEKIEEHEKKGVIDKLFSENNLSITPFFSCSSIFSCEIKCPSSSRGLFSAISLFISLRLCSSSGIEYIVALNSRKLQVFRGCFDPQLCGVHKLWRAR